jgi:hypothetical protein
LGIGLGIAFFGGGAERAFEEDFAFGDFGGVFGIQFGQLFLFLVAQFDGWGAFAQAFHRQFVG